MLLLVYFQLKVIDNEEGNHKGGGASREDSGGFLLRVSIKRNRKRGGAS